MQTIWELPSAPSRLEVHYVPAIPKEYAVPRSGDLNKPQQLILATLFEFGHLATEDILDANNWRSGYLRDIQKHLAFLNQAEIPKDRYVEKIIPAKQTRYGSAPYVYTLGRRGYRYLKSQGYEIDRSRGIDELLHKRIPLSHRLAVNRFLLHAKRLERDYSGVFLQEYLTEKACNAAPLRVQSVTDTGEKTLVSISPDLLLHFVIDSPKRQYRFLPEINLSKVSPPVWRKKIRAYLHCLEAYVERFGTRLLTAIPVMVASDGDFPRRNLAKLTPLECQERKLEAKRREKRMQNLIQWTEAELTKLTLQQEADLFRFSCVPLDEITAYELFFSPVWHLPYSSTPTSLMRYQRGDDGL